MRNVLVVILAVLGMVQAAYAETKVTIALNWVPEPEFGGIYAAKIDGTYSRNGLDVEIQPGGAGAPTWQMVATGKVEFAVSSADEVVMARAKGADVVAIFAIYQTCPQAIMVHRSRELRSIDEVFQKGGTLAMEVGLPYGKFLQNKYGFQNVKRITYDGGIANFLADKNFMQQCFVFSEPIAAKRAGADPQTFLVADAGYNPYTGVIITRGEYLKSNPKEVMAMVQSLRGGWQSYLNDPKAANEAMGKINKAMDAQTFADAAEAQKPLIDPSEGRTKPPIIGTMILPRWQELVQQLVELKVIEKPIQAEQCFTDPLPQK
jgi:NitT/TauT family transport system substrate-binding protein